MGWLEVTLGRLGFHFIVCYLRVRLRSCLLLMTDLLNWFISQKKNKHRPNYKHNVPPLPRIEDLMQTVQILNQADLMSRVDHLEPHHSPSPTHYKSHRKTPHAKNWRGRKSRRREAKWHLLETICLISAARWKRSVSSTGSFQQDCNYITSLRNSAFGKSGRKWVGWDHGGILKSR